VRAAGVRVAIVDCAQIPIIAVRRCILAFARALAARIAGAGIGVIAIDGLIHAAPGIRIAVIRVRAGISIVTVQGLVDAVTCLRVARIGCTGVAVVALTVVQAIDAYVVGLITRVVHENAAVD
jgi:hypothetical protein